MIVNLFSIFDPSISLFQFCWFPIFVAPYVAFAGFCFLVNSKGLLLIKLIYRTLNAEFTVLSGLNKNKISNHFICSIFFMLLVFNLIGLIPFTFTLTAHLRIRLSLSIIIWLGIILFGLNKNVKIIMSHLVPIGTPYPLINFIVVIELIRNVIRPVTLAVRLSANMVAGHLLISLLGAFCLSPSTSFGFSVITMLALLEVRVSFIQCYVLVLLLTLYITEIN